MKIDFKPLKSDPCVCVYYTDDDSINNSTANTSRKPDGIITLYVDDLVLAGGDKAVLKMLKEKLMSRFVKTNTGDISLMLGMKVTRNRENGTLTISQADYTKVRVRSVRNGGVQTREHAWSRKGTVTQPARRELS